MTSSFLAAVRAAAQSSTSPAAITAGSQPKETSMAGTTEGQAATPAVQVKPTTVIELAAAFPDLVASIRTEAATAERDRIAGIDRVAAGRKGIGELVTAMKADAKCSPEQAAMRILEAENTKLAAHAANIAGVETVTGKVNAAPNVAGAGGEPKVTATTPDGWKAEYAASAGLQAEFATAADYVAFKANEGNVRILGQRKTA
jgi:hypothetical protein